ncbi:MAG: small ribosomal subunit Rsm22 family protein [Alphaproteobacteria bacterium]|nr:small ribosomal subunit Rsm22 family protein [Alphaproteobacteria bacterium]
MLSPALPADLKAALAERLHGFSRKEAAARANIISQAYRCGGDSTTIRSREDALSYALTRMPATYAAVTACLNALTEQTPALTPQSLIDIGAGPGTASFAAAQAFATLHAFTLIDANPALRQLGLELTGLHPRLASCHYSEGDGTDRIRECAPSDIVIASFCIGEIAPAERAELAAAMWERTLAALIVIEPGTPKGHARILALRRQLIGSGAHVAAPCPHALACPLIAPDWCHFSQRLPRSQAHRQIKGAEVPFEDEKFSYVVLTRSPIPRVRARVIAPPRIGKAAITARLCDAAGVHPASVARRDREAYATARHWRWGTALREED